MYNDAKIYENHLNPVLWVLIGKLSLSTLRFSVIFQFFSHLFALVKLIPSSIRDNDMLFIAKSVNLNLDVNLLIVL